MFVKGAVNPFPNKPWFLRVCSTSPKQALVFTCLQYKSKTSPGFYVSAVQVQNKPWFLRVCSTSPKQALVFTCLQYKSQTSPGFYVSAVQVQNKRWFLRVCSTSPKQALVFTCLQYKSFENTAGKGEIARNEQFLLFPQCFLSILENYLPISANLKLSSANSFSLEESKFCRLVRS